MIEPLLRVAADVHPAIPVKHSLYLRETEVAEREWNGSADMIESP